MAAGTFAYRFTGSEARMVTEGSLADGSTVFASPGEVYEFDAPVFADDLEWAGKGEAPAKPTTAPQVTEVRDVAPIEAPEDAAEGSEGAPDAATADAEGEAAQEDAGAQDEAPEGAGDEGEAKGDAEE